MTEALKVDQRRLVCWFSCGAASAVATKLIIQAQTRAENSGNSPREIVVAYCDTGSEDEDNSRFLSDCERWFGQSVVRLQNDKYRDTWDLWERRGYMAGINGAICTGEFKFAPRLDFQRPSDIHVFGYTADKADIKRAERLRETYPEMSIVTPLIDQGITKDICRVSLKIAGIAEPRTYAMGFPNANCLKSGCCKSTSPDYWANHRKWFPEGFAETARIARKLGVRLARIKGERVFIDDIPSDWPTQNAEAPPCDFLCQIISEDLAA